MDSFRRRIAAVRDEDWYTLEWAPRREFYRNAFYTLSFNQISGDYVEFGCGTRSLILAYQASRRAGRNCKLWGFDTFDGLPNQRRKEDDHPRWIAGTMKTPIEGLRQSARWYGLREGMDYVLVEGLYERTLKLNQIPCDISLAYVDCDLYSSTREALEFLGPRFKIGMIIAFDDYFCYSSHQVSGERRAAVEVFEKSEEWNFVPYIQFGWFGMSFVVEKRNLL